MVNCNNTHCWKEWEIQAYLITSNSHHPTSSYFMWNLITCGIFRASLNLLWKNTLGGPHKVSLTLNEISRTFGILDRCIKSFCDYGDFKTQRTQSTLKRSLFLLKAFLMSSLNLSSCPIHTTIKILYSLSNSLLHTLCLLLFFFLLSFESQFS